MVSSETAGALELSSCRESFKAVTNELRGLGDDQRISKAKQAFRHFETGLEKATDPEARAHCLKGMGVATFNQAPRLTLMNPPSLPELERGQEHIHAALATLEEAGLTSALAAMCLEVAESFPWVFISNMEGAVQREVGRARAGLLRRAATLFASLDDDEGELQALRRLRLFATVSELERRIELACSLEGESSVPRAEDMIGLARRKTQKNPMEAIALLDEAALVLARDPAQQQQLSETLLSLGFTHKRARQREKSANRFREALAVYQKLEHDGRISYTALFLGSYALEQDDLDASLRYYTQALKHQDCPRRKGEASMGLALVRSIKGEREAAIQTLRTVDVYSWEILASEFDRFFFVPQTIQAHAAQLFDKAGFASASRSIRAWKQSP